MEKKYPSKKICEKMHRYCDQSQYGEIGFWKNLRKTYHLLFCGFCRNYAEKNSKLTKKIKESGISCLKPHEIERIKQRLHDESRQ